MIARVVRPVVRNLFNYTEVIGTRVSAYHAPAHHKPVSLDDLPIPQGSWQSQFDAKQRKYNLHLLVGVAFATATIIVAKSSGLIQLNSRIPQLKDN